MIICMAHWRWTQMLFSGQLEDSPPHFSKINFYKISSLVVNFICFKGTPLRFSTFLQGYNHVTFKKINIPDSNHISKNNTVWAKQSTVVVAPYSIKTYIPGQAISHSEGWYHQHVLATITDTTCRQPFPQAAHECFDESLKNVLAFRGLLWPHIYMVVAYIWCTNICCLASESCCYFQTTKRYFWEEAVIFRNKLLF